MELFLPSILIFILSIIVVVAIVPRFSPIIIVTLAILLLGAGTYNHFSMFWNEYRQSTWQQTLKFFAPGIILIAIFIYLFFAIGSFFTGGQVPVPTIPAITIPSADTATNFLTASINNTMKAANTAVNSIASVVKPNANANATATATAKPNVTPKNNGRNNQNVPNITRSQLAAF